MRQVPVTDRSEETVPPMRRYAAPAALFLAFLAFFVWNSAWHLPSQLVITGQLESPADVRVSWDSGSGFNDMESADAIFGRVVDEDFKSRIIRIRRVGRGHPSSKSSEVWIKALQRSQDEHPIDLTTLPQQNGVERTAHGHLRLNADHVELQAPAGKKYTAICFIANEHAGFVEIDIDGDRRLYDLYAEQPQEKWIVRKRGIYAPGEFTVRVNLPRYDIRRLKISSADPLQTFRLASVRIASEKGDIVLPLNGSGFRSGVAFDGFPRNTRQYFHTIHLLQQVLFALLSAWITFSIFRFIRRRGGIVAVLFEGQRPVFWLMFAGGVLAFGAWLLVYWPGHFTTDSVHIWWAARQPGYFMHDHPVMNVIFYRYLQQFRDHFAMVGIAQILLTSLLGAYILFWIYRKGVPLFIVLPFYLLFIASIPVGVYSVTLWKDIPFALLVVFWAFWLVKLTFERREGAARHSRSGLIALFLLLIALCFFRYNGIVYFIIIPAGLALMGIIPFKKFLFGTAGILALAAILLTVTILLDKSNFFTSQSRFFIERMGSFGIGETAVRVVKQYPTLLDVNIFQKRKIWYDTWYRDSAVTKWHQGFARQKGYNEWIRYMPCEPKSDRLYRLLHPLNLKSAAEPWVYFTWNPFYMLLLFPVCFLYRLFPLTASFGYVVLSQVLVLLLVLGPYNYNWRYYYFLFVSLYFLIPLIALDGQSLRGRFQVRERRG